MWIQLTNFRAFEDTGKIYLSRFNLLVGENSAGKSSFLAALKYVYIFLGRRGRPSFNEDPFFLGSFDDIVYNSGPASKCKADNFSISIGGAITQPESTSHQSDLFNKKRRSVRGPEKEFSFNIKFHDRKTQPAIASISFECGAYCAFIDFLNDKKIEITTPSANNLSIENKIPGFPGKEYYFDAYMLDFIIQHSVISALESGSINRSKPEEDKIDRKRLENELMEFGVLYRKTMRYFEREVYASAPMRSKPKRVYSPADFSHSSDGEHTPSVLAQLQSFEPEQWARIQKSLNRFGSKAGLFDYIDVHRIGGKKNKGGPFEILVKNKKKKVNLIDVGYGVSQSIPVAVELLNKKNTVFLLQQPEVHLHPKAQAALGEFLLDSALELKHDLFVETHSDYLVDRMRLAVRNRNDVTIEDITIMYFERHEIGSKIFCIKMDYFGNIVDSPLGYRDFFIKEEMFNLGIEE